jgi:hypothetical protein
MPRVDVLFFEGVNTAVEHNLSKKTELEESENARSTKYGSIEKRRGFTLVAGGVGLNITNQGLFYFENSSNMKFLYRVSTTGGVTSVYYLNNSDAWVALAGAGTGLSVSNMFTTTAENCCFMVNGTDENRYIGTNGTTVVASTTSATTNHLYNSPKANLVNYYKNRLYMADFYLGSTRYKNGVAFSSRPMGLVSLTSGDTLAGVTLLNVTDTKYIYPSDTLDVIRGGVKITQITITAKTEYTITVSATAVDIKSADELWVKDTYDGTAPMVFRWASVSGGTNSTRYDTFKLAGGDSTPITMLTNIGDTMAIANKNSFMVWNDAALTSFDSGVGCVSKRGHVRSNNMLFFVHYNGIYVSTGAEPKLISSKVQAYFDGATKASLETAAAGKKGMCVFFWIGNVTLYNIDGSINKTLSNVVLEYNLKQEGWYVHTGIPASQFTTYVEATDPDKIVFTNSSTGHIYEFLNGTSDNGSAIPFSITTSDLTLNREFERISYPKQFIVEVEAGNNVKPFVSIDHAQFYELGLSASKGCAVVPVTPREPNDKYARGRKIKLCLKEMSTTPCKVTRLSLIYTDSAEQEVQRS